MTNQENKSKQDLDEKAIKMKNWLRNFNKPTEVFEKTNDFISDNLSSENSDFFCKSETIYKQIMKMNIGSLIAINKNSDFIRLAYDKNQTENIEENDIEIKNIKNGFEIVEKIKCVEILRKDRKRSDEYNRNKAKNVKAKIWNPIEENETINHIISELEKKDRNKKIIIGVYINIDILGIPENEIIKITNAIKNHNFNFKKIYLLTNKEANYFIEIENNNHN